MGLQCPKLPRFRVIMQYLLIIVVIMLIHLLFSPKSRCSDRASGVLSRESRATNETTSLVSTLLASLTPNEILKSTAIGVKTFNRPECLTEFIASVRKYAPYLAIFVIDDSDVESRALLLEKNDQGDVYIMLPTDSGAGHGRNRIVQAMRDAGYEYFIMADDDIILTSENTIPLLARHLIETGSDLVAATRCEGSMDNCPLDAGMLMVDDARNLTLLPNVSTYPKYVNSPACSRSDVVQTFFLARTQALLRVHWDNSLRSNEHYDFLFSARRYNVTLVTCSDVTVLHEKSCRAASMARGSYKEKRGVRWLQEMAYVSQKWQLARMYLGDGEEYHVDDTNTVNKRQMSTQNHRANSSTERYLVGSILDTLNGYTSGSTQIRPSFSKFTEVTRTEYSPCVNNISATIHYHSTSRNQTQASNFSRFFFNESCPFAEQLWQVRHYGRVSDHSHVYYVTAFAHDDANLLRLLDNLQSDTSRIHVTFIVVAMDDKTAATVKNYKSRDEGMSVDVVDVGPPFSRSVGLRVGFRRALELAGKAGHRSAIGVALQTSASLPPEFSSRVRSLVQCGVSVFAPICYNYKSRLEDTNHQTAGLGDDAEFGTIALCLQDYVKIRGSHGRSYYSWSDDVDFMEDVNKQIPFIYRAIEKEYICRYESTREELTSSKQKSINSKLNSLSFNPSSSFSTVTNQDFGQRLLSFVKSSILEFQENDWDIVQVSRTYTEGTRGILYYAVVSIHQNYNDKRYFLVYSHLSPILPS